MFILIAEWFACVITDYAGKAIKKRAHSVSGAPMLNKKVSNLVSKVWFLCLIILKLSAAQLVR